MSTRDSVNFWAGLVAAFAGAMSVLAAALYPDWRALGKALILIWAVGPPAFFWFDWVVMCRDMPPEAKERDVAKHTHDLARNIWLALLGVLAVMFQLKV